MNEPEEHPVARPARGPSSYGFPKDGTAGLLPWSHATTRLVAARNYWLATTSPAGRPHVTPLWGVWVAGALYFDGAPQTRWARNLTANPHATVHLEDGDDVVIIEGTVEDIMHVEDAELAAAIITAWDGKYGRLHPDPAGNGIWRLRPRNARAWSNAALTDATRWDYPPPTVGA